MFDIVNQDFYGNSGTGYFIYGQEPYNNNNYNDGYYFDTAGRLIDADSDIYLKATGTQYIKTNYTANPNTRVYMDYKMNATTGQQYLFGAWAITDTKYLCMVAYINGSTSLGRWAECSRDQITGNSGGHASTTNADLKRHQLIISAQKHVEYWPGATFDSLSATPSTTTPTPLGIFSRYDGTHLSNMNVYRFKIWNNNTTLAHDFVPVPAGLVIGSYTVPSNGLWDIVDQVFYGNSGTGEFIYGKD